MFQTIRGQDSPYYKFLERKLEGQGNTISVERFLFQVEVLV